MVALRSGDKFVFMLYRASEIELGFQPDSRWRSEKEKLRSLPMELIVNASQHANMVQHLMDMVEVTPGKTSPPRLGRAFKLSNKREPETMMGIRSSEVLIRDMVRAVRNASHASISGPLPRAGGYRAVPCNGRASFPPRTITSSRSAITQVRWRGPIEAPAGDVGGS